MANLLGRWLAILIFCFPLGPGSPVDASAEPPVAAPEYNVKAGYILLFIRYVDWPAGAFPSPESPIVVGILGWDPFGKVLDETLKGLSVEGRKVEVRRVPDVKAALGCHAVFMGRTEQNRLAEWLDELGNQPILSITESAGAIESGAIVNFVMEGNTLRFEINRLAAVRSGIKIASPMMMSAKSIHGGKPSRKAED